MSDDREELAGYVEVWWQAVNDFLDLLEQVPEEEWTTPTDLAGWDVKACAAHVAHLEGVLAGAPEETAEVGEPAHVTGLMGLYTEIGVVNRREASADSIINELRESATKRHTALLADPPTDGDAKPDVIFGGVPWSWRTLLRNRPLDVWMHEQDVRRAVGRPGGMDTPAARHTAEYLAERSAPRPARAWCSTCPAARRSPSRSARTAGAGASSLRSSPPRRCGWTASRSSGSRAGDATPSPAP
jgi:uncharacterized protein (TIGR03083 family)